MPRKFLCKFPLVTACALAGSLLWPALPPAAAASRQLPAPLSATARVGAVRVLRRLGVLGSNAPLVRALTLRGERLGAPALRAQTVRPQAAAAGITFTCTGFSAFQAGLDAKYQSFLRGAYADMVRFYGAPAPEQAGVTISVAFDGNVGDGVYHPPSAKDPQSNQIFYTPINQDRLKNHETALPQDEVDQADFYNLARLALRAFHGSRYFGSDAWEQGFADAAALLVIYREQGSPGDFDPSSLGLYFLPFYDLFNTPNLGNRYFYPLSADTGNLGAYRTGMAQAAWLKVYIENSAFFSRFNAAYYKTGIDPENDAALVQLAASVVPRVEGLNFADWCRRQYILDTRVVAGSKLWFATVPYSATAVAGVGQWFQTFYDSQGRADERPLHGWGQVAAADENGVDITATSPELLADHRVQFDAQGDTELNIQNVADTVSPTISFAAIGGTPEQAAIKLTVQAGAQSAQDWFPYNVLGTGTAPAAFYGATIGCHAGVITVATGVPGRSPGSTTNAVVARSVFGTSGLTYPSVPALQTTLRLRPTDGSAARVFVRNSAWARGAGLVVLLQTPSSQSTQAVPLAAGLQMVSLPIDPVQTDELAVLGTTLKNLQLLARYRPNLNAAKTGKGALPFGIDAQRHDLYPSIHEPFAPGRGYWLQLAKGFNARIVGAVGASPASVELQGGWNQVGVPFPLRFAVGALRVSYKNGTPVTWSQAVQNRWVWPGIWRWKPAGGYGRVDVGGAANGFIGPFEGVYLFTPIDSGVKLLFDVHQPLEQASLPPQSASNWQLALIARSGTAIDSDNAFGVATATAAVPAAAPAAKPPCAVRTLTVHFTASGSSVAEATRAGNESGWAECLTAPILKPYTYTFVVDGMTEGAPVVLTWSDPSTLTAPLDFTLTDLFTRKTVALTGAARVRSYSFIGTTAPRVFTIVAAPPAAKAQPAATANLTVVPWTGSRCATLRVRWAPENLPVTSYVVTVETTQGEALASWAGQEFDGTAGLSWFWSGRDESGVVQPVGNYLARVVWVDGSGGKHDESVAFELR